MSSAINASYTASSDSESDEEPNLGSFRPVRRFQRSTTTSDPIRKLLSSPDPHAAEREALGDFYDAISFLREHGEIPDLPLRTVSFTSGSHEITTSKPKASTKIKHSSSLSDASDINAASLSSTAVYSTPPSSPDDPITIAQQYKGKGVRWTESVANGSESEDEASNQLAVMSSYEPRNTQKDQTTPGIFRLLPSSIIPPPALQQPQPNRNEIRPIHTLTLAEKQDKLIKKLSVKFSEEPNMQLAQRNPMLIMGLASNKSSKGIHVFVDLSNVTIGFADQLKADRNISKAAHKRQPPLAFHFLAMVLERGRPAARRIVAGSTVTKEGREPTTPGYISEAAACGYELNILERVRKMKAIKTGNSYKHKKATSSGRGFGVPGYSSASDSAATALANAEQGVDEILHLKMMESILDTAKPSTMVVASGDAARAEYSGGFLAMILRALNRGWKVEVVAWQSGLSSEYKSHAFLKRWASQFKVILLDDYVEEMFAIYADQFMHMDANSYNRY